MKLNLLFLLVVTLILFWGLSEGNAQQMAARAVIKSWRRWRLARLPKVKDFIVNEANKYSNLEVQFVGGDPRIEFLNDKDEQIEDTQLLANYDQEGIRNLLSTKGIILKHTDL